MVGGWPLTAVRDENSQYEATVSAPTMTIGTEVKRRDWPGKCGWRWESLVVHLVAHSGNDERQLRIVIVIGEVGAWCLGLWWW